MRTFFLTRYFTVLSFVLIVLAGGLLGHFVYQQESGQLLHSAESRNVATTHIFRNALWADFAYLTAPGVDTTPAKLRQLAEQHGLQAKVANLMRDAKIVKVKVYNLDGVTVFSSDPKQTGENKRNNPGFVSAVGGKAATELTHRNEFDAFEGTKTDLDIIFSYVPVRDGERIVGVLEVYQDVTHFVQEVEEARRAVWLVVLAVLAVLYLLQLVIVRRAQRLLRVQADELAAANRDLDLRVQERTKALQAEIVERRNAEARLDHLAHHDPLTSLPNRLMFADQLRHSIGLAGRGKRQLAVLFIDLDRFKEVNDTLGHAVGDELLIAATKRLVGHLRASDTLARLGGDEFVCTIEDVTDPSEASAVADKLIEQLSQPFLVGEYELFVSASIGICLYPADGEDVDTLVRNADTAMYQAKAAGRSRSHFYSPEMTAYARERSRIEGLLRRAIDANELAVHYQTKVDPEGRPTGAEALLRWNSAELGNVAPVRFIPLAEETGLIIPLGEWILRQACRQMMDWRAAGLNVPRVSVNLSVKQIQNADIVTTVRKVLDDTGLEPAALELEITESVIMNIEDALTILERLQSLGVQLAIDDFGTGYSSLAYLKRMPVNTLKIDRAFVIGIGENAGDEAIIRTIVALARSLKLTTVAEGVESAQQLAFLSAHGCNEIQGYYFSKPQPADTFVASWRKMMPPA
jgi:diguanylate cyclase (GGDEF)-like protein